MLRLRLGCVVSKQLFAVVNQAICAGQGEKGIVVAGISPGHVTGMVGSGYIKGNASKDGGQVETFAFGVNKNRADGTWRRRIIWICLPYDWIIGVGSAVPTAAAASTSSAWRRSKRHAWGRTGSSLLA